MLYLKSKFRECHLIDCTMVVIWKNLYIVLKLTIKLSLQQQL